MNWSGPEVIAHRGASVRQPEHTLAAFRQAMELGADALECDVRLTADGHLVCVHDRRVDRTSNGTGLVSTLELTELEGLDWGSWKQAHPDDAEEPFVVDAHERSHLLTLRRLLTLVRDCGRDVRISIETKHPTRYGGQVERSLAAILEEFGWARPASPEEARVRVMSFSALAVRRMRQLTPDLPLALLLEHVPLGLRDGALPRGVGIAAISVELLRARPEYVDRVHCAGHQVHVWCVDEVDDVERCLAAGVEGIISNRPDLVLAVLGRAGTGAPASAPPAPRSPRASAVRLPR